MLRKTSICNAIHPNSNFIHTFYCPRFLKGETGMTTSWSHRMASHQRVRSKA